MENFRKKITYTKDELFIIEKNSKNVNLEVVNIIIASPVYKHKNS